MVREQQQLQQLLQLPELQVDFEVIAIVDEGKWLAFVVAFVFVALRQTATTCITVIRAAVASSTDTLPPSINVLL